MTLSPNGLIPFISGTIPPDANFGTFKPFGASSTSVFALADASLLLSRVFISVNRILFRFLIRAFLLLLSLFPSKKFCIIFCLNACSNVIFNNSSFPHRFLILALGTFFNLGFFKNSFTISTIFAHLFLYILSYCSDNPDLLEFPFLTL